MKKLINQLVIKFKGVKYSVQEVDTSRINSSVQICQNKYNNVELLLSKIAEIEILKEKKATDLYGCDIEDIKHSYMVGRDGNISGGTLVYLKNGNTVSI